MVVASCCGVVHALKTEQPYFNDIKSGAKTFELRKNDRNYKVGDTLILQEWSSTGGYTGETVVKIVTYILKDCVEYGLQDGYCILGIDDGMIV